jgi:hypothetical protein
MRLDHDAMPACEIMTAPASSSLWPVARRRAAAAILGLGLGVLATTTAWAAPARPLVQFLEEAETVGPSSGGTALVTQTGTTGELYPVDSLLTSNAVRIWWAPNDFSDNTFWQNGRVDPAIKRLFKPSPAAMGEAQWAEWLSLGGVASQWVGNVGFWFSLILAAAQVVDFFATGFDGDAYAVWRRNDVQLCMMRFAACFGYAAVAGTLPKLQPVCDRAAKAHADNAVRLWNAGK